MKKRLLVVFLGPLLVLALVAPMAAIAAGTDSYSAYGSALRQTYGDGLRQITVNSPGCYGVRLGHERSITSQSYGVRLGQHTTLTPQTYGSQLWNRSGNPSLIPYLLGNINPAATVF